ncbi:thiamine phosphate synthase [Alcanivorax sp. HI0033]|uniref:thiamine phosphate synthase n=1 Tax=unclassified Alcanivorax TaxID=2638842 RepID=UPI0007B896FB|nr:MULTISPECIES: thiamine phosphate synthase [unclassified Alcanivorax]KZX78192.1 thiamine phosphate synthase [Alcanivorax sp. HI0013]KZX81104.1 thiamine phosphate synthase [Alcanivorax sp. HI0011]KZY13103.1 thiamine phosphate synthase [Alcanivorax sp. HI0035]KZX61513.1 thiamine phosphate synthase [Alcanivorax sp. HI0003]KZX67543.1 thiamine phosphate synthase [Alcanivorax sp. HI0007]
MKHPAIHGLYAITDPALIPDRQLLPAAEAALRGGARLLQYRDKTATPAQRRHRASQLQTLCRQYGALFLVNDDPALAADIEADGVHIGQSDGGIARARQRLGPGKIIGVTCHGDLILAEQAAEAGADYVAFGRFFPSRTKPQAPPADSAILQQARKRLAIPLVAIGGIDAENGGRLLEQGADALAVIHALFSSPAPEHVEQAARRLAALFVTG